MTLASRIKSILRAAGTAALAAVLLPLSMYPADAASICARLRDQLNSATETIGNTAQTRAYARAIARQNQEILKVRADMRSYGCSSGSIIVVGGPNARACNTLTGALARMQDNLSTLQDHQTSLVTHSLSRGERQRILNALDANGCNDIANDPPENAALTPASVNANYAKTAAETATPQENFEIRNLGGSSRSGSLQTLCVRTCDGGFFPISSNATTAGFARDAQVCSMMCPGVSTQLFYRSVGSQESSDMISTVDGRTYGEEPFAYKYRNSAPSSKKACGCNFSAYYKEMMRREAGEVTGGATPEQYSSIDHIGSNLEIRRTDAKPLPVKKRPARTYDPSTQHVRQVGPVFLPAQNDAINLHDPDRSARD